MTDDKGVGSLPDAGTIKPGDPGHIETHDEMARLVQVAADSLGIILDPPAPPPAVVGQYGHVDAHNTLLANIEQLAAAGGGGLPGELPGLGGWATITAVSGSPKRYAYNDGPGGVGGTDWVAFEWTADGSLVTSGGLVDSLLISAAWPNGTNATVGAVNGGLFDVDGNPQDIKVASTTATAVDARTLLGAYGSQSTLPITNSSYHQFIVPFASEITGPEKLYANTSGSTPGSLGQGGACIVRVPASQADGVDPGSWVTRIDYYAEVTDGIVTDLYQERFYGDDTVRTENGQFASPEQPDDLIPCDPMVAEGWTYDGKDFTPPPPPPPPSREELIAELQARIDELTKDKK